MPEPAPTTPDKKNRDQNGPEESSPLGALGDLAGRFKRDKGDSPAPPVGPGLTGKVASRIPGASRLTGQDAGSGSTESSSNKPGAAKSGGSKPAGSDDAIETAWPKVDAPSRSRSESPSRSRSNAPGAPRSGEVVSRSSGSGSGSSRSGSGASGTKRPNTGPRPSGGSGRTSGPNPRASSGRATEASPAARPSGTRPVVGDGASNPRHAVFKPPAQSRGGSSIPYEGPPPKKIEVIRGRRSRRIVRRLDTWTVLKVSALFFLCAWIVLLVSTIVLWAIASAVGSITDIEKAIKSLFDYNSYHLHEGAVLLYVALGGMIIGIFGTLINTLGSLLYNLISDVVGGVQVIVLAEDEQFPDQ